MNNSAYYTATEIALEYLDRWTNEARTASVLLERHPGPAECALQRSREAAISYFAVCKVRNALYKEQS